MCSTIRITLVQTNIFWEKKEKNYQNFERIFSKIKNSDLVVLPEMFTTGFNMNPSELAEDWKGFTVQWLRKNALKHNFAIAGSIIFKDNNKFYNRLLFVFPDGSITFYDKRHRFTMSNEHHKYSAGNKIVTTVYKGWKIRLAICYDLRFPVWTRNTDGYHILLFVANWPASRIWQWKNLLLARAIENQAYVVAVNRIGTDGNNFFYSGHSLAVDFKGNIIYEAPDNQEDIKTISLNLNPLIDGRKKFPVLNDADKFSIL